MEELRLQFLPYPHVYRGERRPGVHFDWPARCYSCDRQCERIANSGVQVCAYGVNYVRVDDDLLIAGIVVRDFPGESQAFNKMRRKMKGQTVTLRDLTRMLEVAKATSKELIKEVELQKRSILDDYRRSEIYKTEIVALLKPDIQRALAQVHDYRQLITQIVQNVNVIISTENPHAEFRAALDSASHEIQAIYWSARLMETKLEAALFLMHPEKISDPMQMRKFRLHGLVTKYARIYTRSFESQDIKIRFSGESRGELYANPDAVGVIPHAYLDNAVKYAPRATFVDIDFVEDKNYITFCIASYGPRMLRDEKERVFDLFFRGAEAQARAVEGTGFGLALAQLVATNIGATLTVKQSSDAGPQDTFLTTFSAKFAKAHQ